MTVDELITQLQAVQARGGGKLQVATPDWKRDPQDLAAIYQLAVISTEPKGKGVRYISLNPTLREFDRKIPDDQALEDRS